MDVIALPGIRQIGASKLADTSVATDAVNPDRHVMDVRDQIRRLIAAGWVEELVVRYESPPDSLREVIEAGRLAGRKVRLISSVPVSQLPLARNRERWSSQIRDGDQTWVLLPRQRSVWGQTLKRVMDVVVATSLLLLLFPVLLLIAAAVKLTSEGPIFYSWRVLGKNGRPFVGYKFRTMVRDADVLKSQLLHLNERHGPVFKMAQDPRVTRVGRWLRKHSLDELPQLWSVLIGDMSLVGPRPAFVSEYVKYELWQMRRLSVVPGLTCLWQLEGRRTVNEFSEWARMDLRYIDSWSLRKDLLILLRTPMAIIKGTGH
jgi:lipopolysaccharide/colanic/teichoic acid biosynthesis glycosyltransferase